MDSGVLPRCGLALLEPFRIRSGYSASLGDDNVSLGCPRPRAESRIHGSIRCLMGRGARRRDRVVSMAAFQSQRQLGLVMRWITKG